MSNDLLIVRLQERIKIYRDSPGVTLTYVDAAQLCEIILECLTSTRDMGFKSQNV